MTLRRASIAVLLLLAAAVRAEAPSDTYCNPLDVLVADPFIHRQGETYFLYGTTGGNRLYVWTSEDLVRWHIRGLAFQGTGETWARTDFWAPELFRHGDRCYLHFTARGGDELIRRVVLAAGDSPLGPFRELKAPWFDPGGSTIDGHVFRDDDGQLYLYSVATHETHGGKFEIQVRPLDERLEAPAKGTPCISPSLPWEGGYVNEGPFVLKRDGDYVLTFSANGFRDPNYCVGLATAKSPLGPWTKHAAGPILFRSKTVSGPGHHCFVDSPDGSELFIAYHTHQSMERPGAPRQLAIDRATWVDGPVPRLAIGAATDAPRPMPAGAHPLVRGESDEFDGDSLDRRRWTIFGEDPSHWTMQDGRLAIEAVDGDVHQQRSDLSNLFLQPAPAGDFEVTTRVTIDPREDYQQAFLCLWQDHNHFAKLAFAHIGGKRVEIGVETGGRYATDVHATSATDEAWLRVKRRGEDCEFLVSVDGRSWKSVGTRRLALMDLQVGIGACAPAGGKPLPASFDFVRFTALR